MGQGRVGLERPRPPPGPSPEWSCGAKSTSARPYEAHNRPGTLITGRAQRRRGSRASPACQSSGLPWLCVARVSPSLSPRQRRLLLLVCRRPCAANHSVLKAGGEGVWLRPACDWRRRERGWPEGRGRDGGARRRSGVAVAAR